MQHQLHSHRKEVGPPARAILWPLLIGSGLLWLGVSVDIARANTLLIFVSVAGIGTWLCHRTRVATGDTRLKILGTFWLAKLNITIFLLYAGWIPYLDPMSSPAWGYDPQRYFYDAVELIESGWNPVQGTNYQGIIFYYAGVFYLFGHNPVIPALVNAFVTLLGTLFLIRCVYSLVPDRTPKDWTIAWLLLVPEVLWFDVVTGRDSLMAVLIIIAALGAGRRLCGLPKASLSGALLLTGGALFAILAVRTSMVIPVAVSIGAMSLILRSRRQIDSLVKVLLVSLAITALSAGPLIQELTGGYEVDYLANVNRIQSLDSNVAAEMEWSARSIGLLIAPNNPWEWFFYLPPRMVLYLAAPLPNVAISINELVSGSWSAWQKLMTIPTSFMMLLGFPYVLTGSTQAWRARGDQSAPLVLHIAFWINFMAVAGGNIVIHERYRLMFTLLLFACMWFGYTRSSPREVKRWAVRWYLLLASCAIFYLGYK